MVTIEQARSWYTTSDPVHDFEHVLRVYFLADEIARAENADLEIVHTATLLHDSRGSAPGGTGDSRENHHIYSAEFAKEVLRAEGWPEERIEAVQHCIRSHRFRNKNEQPQTIEAQVVYDADKLDVLGAAGVARTIAYAVLDGQPIYSRPSEKFRKNGQKEPGEKHSSYHEYLYKLVKIKDMLFTPAAKRLAEKRHELLVTFYETLAAEMDHES